MVLQEYRKLTGPRGHQQMQQGSNKQKQDLSVFQSKLEASIR